MQRSFLNCFFCQWIPKAQPCESENILYFIWEGWKLPEIWWKTHVMVGRPAPLSSISSVCEASAEEGDGIILTCQRGISLKDNHDPPVLPVGFLGTPRGLISWALGAWTWAPQFQLPSAVFVLVLCCEAGFGGSGRSANTIYIFIFVFCPLLVACGILVPWPGIEPVPLSLEVWGLNQWTIREVLQQIPY